MAVLGKRGGEDDMDFAREDKRQKTGVVKCPEEAPHDCPRRSQEGKIKWYAVWGGPNPGVHHTNWGTAQQFIEKQGSVKHKSFTDMNQAKAWYDTTKAGSPDLAPRSHQPVPQSRAIIAAHSPILPVSRRNQRETTPGPHNSCGTETSPANHIANTDASQQHSFPHVANHVSSAEQQLDQPSDDVVTVSESVLCPEQSNLVDLILQGRNVFYTGSAGVGKSTVLKIFRHKLRAKNKNIQVLAPTARAALNINGQTTYSFAGWRPESNQLSKDKLERGARGNQILKRLSNTDVLVIDEISMVENNFFQRLNWLMQAACGSGKAFGGVQIVVTGDFCQLPPVKPFTCCVLCGQILEKVSATVYECSAHGQYHDEDKWAFRSDAWKQCDFVHVNLTQIHRQSDTSFINILQKLRIGDPLLPSEKNTLLNHRSETTKAIELFSTRVEVKLVNDKEFEKLKTRARTYNCVDNFSWNEKDDNVKRKGEETEEGTIKALKDHRFESQVQLKEGMLVVLLANIDVDCGLVNGSQGTVIGFQPFAGLDAEQKSEDYTSLSSSNPTYRAPQGFTGRHAAYREDRIEEFMCAVPRTSREWPVVKFLNGQTTMIYAECMVTELGDEHPHSLLSRTQIPLMAGWAMTTHKSQGMTLERVIVDLSRSFEQGQAYVALSRARSLDGLKVVSFPESANGTGNKEVREFLRDEFKMDFS